MMTLEISDLAISFPGLASPVLTIDHLTLEAGGRLAVTGASGSGKSTFVNLVSGLGRPDRGRVVWRGVDIARFDWVDDTTALAAHPAADVVVELVGGSDGPALSLARATLAAGNA